MALSFNGAPGSLFNRLGKAALLVKQLKSYQTAQLTNMTDTTNGVVAQYDSESDIQAIIGNSYISVLGNSDTIISNVVQQLAAATVNRMVFRDNPQLNQTLTQANTLSSLLEIIRQMHVEGATIRAQTVTATPTGFTGVGNGVVVVSVRRPIDGLVLENSFAEELLITCNQDSYTGNASPGNEGFVVTGTGTESDFFAFDWPLGSNCTISAAAIDGDTSAGAGNLLVNSGFASFTLANVPDNWTISVGSAGTNFFQETGLVYSGASALRITGDGSNTLSSILQPFAAGNGTTSNLAPNTQYSINGFLRRDGIAPGAGVLEIALVDQNGNIINDQLGTPNSFTVDLTQLTTVYTGYNGIFRTPTVLPTTQSLRLRLTTALTNGRSIYLGKFSQGIMTQTYTSGPFVSVHSGSIPYVAGDYAMANITNSRGAGGTLSTWQTVMAQFFPDVMNSELLVPSSASPTVPDSLIG